MSLRYRYRVFPMPRSIWTLGGRWVRPRPVITVTVVGPTGTAVREGILDPAADDTVFPDAMATILGLDLTNAPLGEASGVGKIPVALRYAEVTLRITDGREQRQWQARVGFTTVPLNRALLGFAGFLQFYTAVFRGDLEEVELTVNSLYQGT
jgi:hypothetical protein